MPLTTTPISGLYILTFASDASGDTVTGKILVNGKVIGQCHASGPYAVAQTSIDNNDPSGTWSSLNPTGERRGHLNLVPLQHAGDQPDARLTPDLMRSVSSLSAG